MNTTDKLDYVDIAYVQLDRAIDCYEEESFSGYICALSLASAAEGIISQLPGYSDTETTYKNLKKTLAKNFKTKEKAIADKLNLYRNGVKHYKPEMCNHDFEPQIQCNLMIYRAIFAFVDYKGFITEKLSDFTENNSPINLLEERPDNA